MKTTFNVRQYRTSLRRDNTQPLGGKCPFRYASYVILVCAFACAPTENVDDSGDDTECEIPYQNGCVEYTGMCVREAEPRDASEFGLETFYMPERFQSEPPSFDLRLLTQCRDGVNWGRISRDSGGATDSFVEMFNGNMTIQLGYLEPSEPIDPSSDCALGLWVGHPSSYACAHVLLVEKSRAEQDCFSPNTNEATVCDCQIDEYGDPPAVECEQ
jgi:hypothetical protein